MGSHEVGWACNPSVPHLMGRGVRDTGEEQQLETWVKEASRVAALSQAGQGQRREEPGRVLHTRVQGGGSGNAGFQTSGVCDGASCMNTQTDIPCHTGRADLRNYVFPIHFSLDLLC